MLNSKFSLFKKINSYTRFRFVGLVVSLAIVIGHYFLPEKRVILLPRADIQTKLYGYVHPVTGKSDSWIDKREHYWECDFLPGNQFGCGFSAVSDPEYQNGLDLRYYKGIEYSLKYEGPAERIRFYIRNANNNYYFAEDENTSKYMSMSLQISEVVDGPVFIALEEFTVADWWLRSKDISRLWSAPEFSNIIDVGLDFTQAGIHKTRVEKIVLVGEWINTNILLTTIIVFWVGVFLVEGLVKFYVVYKRSVEGQLTVNDLENQQLDLENENANLELIYQTDPLTGVNNRAGLNKAIDRHFKIGSSGMCIILLDIDYFKSINDKFGHDIGDKVLKKFATVLLQELISGETVARWGGEEFVLLVRASSAEEFENEVLMRAESLREKIGGTVFDEKLNLTLTSSVGVSWVNEGEDFETVFKRADNALYKAKTGGRNCVKWEM